MDEAGLQSILAMIGCYSGRVDGVYGPMTKAGVYRALTMGPDTRLTDADYAASAERLECEARAIKAFATVESAGSGFADGRPVLLFEPHRFSKATHGRYDATDPRVSYPRWDPKRYPAAQSERYAQLLEAVGLDVDAGFASASYGKFQILGENYRRCGFTTPCAFAFSMAKDEQAQLKAFESFISTGHGMLDALREKRWGRLAAGYNGTGYLLNHYDTKLAAAYAALGG